MGRETRNRPLKQQTRKHKDKYAKQKRNQSQEGVVIRNFRRDVIDKTLIEGERHYISFNPEAYNYTGSVDNFEERKYRDY